MEKTITVVAHQRRAGGRQSWSDNISLSRKSHPQEICLPARQKPGHERGDTGKHHKTLCWEAGG
ncbi:MAG: hypothetical protein NZM25_02490 [Leptospiraceae bacterium]|nr:hypothetical protein [Leptospiraceae bacterium]